MTQEELAKKLKTSISVVGRYERDEMTPNIEVAKKISPKTWNYSRLPIR